MKFYLLTFIFCTGVAFTTRAQNSTERTVNDATQAIGNLKGLFGKKKPADKKDAATTATNATTNTTPNPTDTKKTNTNLPANGTTAAGPIVNGNNPRVYFAGNTSAKTKVIDCDEMWPYNLGAARIRKGQSYALIDSAGNFIVPFNKYTNITETVSYGVRTGIYRVQHYQNNINNEYYINSSGKVLWDITANKYKTYSDYMSNDGQFIMLKPIKKDEKSGDPYMSTIIDKNGKQYHVTLRDGYNMQDSVITFGEYVGTNYLYGFKNLNNVTVVKPTFTKLDSFCDGLAVFEVKDQFGESKAGIIDRKGKIIVPPALSSGFYYRINSTNGMSDIVEIQGTGNTDYYFEYLNVLTGKIIYKTNKGNTYVSYEKLTVSPNSYLRSYNKTNDFFVDPLGNIIHTNEFINRFTTTTGPLSAKYKPAGYATGFRDRIIFYVTPPNAGYKNTTAVYNISNDSIIIGPFNTSHNMLQVVDSDPVSHLSLICFATDKVDNLNHDVFINGYMNNKGELVMMQSAGQ